MQEQSKKRVIQTASVDLETEMLMAASALASSNPEQFLEELEWSIAENFDVMDPSTMHHGTARPFHDRDWYESWLSTTGRNTKMRIVVGRIANMEMIVLPLCLQKAGPFTKALFIAGDASDYNQPIFHKALAEFVSPAFFEAMWCKISPMIEEADTLSLRKLLQDPGHGCGRAIWQPRRIELEASHHTILSGSWDESQGRFFGKSSRRSLSRKEKKISAFGDISYENIREADARIRAIETLCRWKSLQLSNLGLANPFAGGDFQQFLTRIVGTGDPDVYRIYCMSAGDKPLSITLMICHNERWFLYQTAYTDEEAGKYSPGLSLLREILKCAHDEGCKIFDFGLGNEGYKKKYCDQELTLYRSEIALSAKGWLAKAYFDAEQGTRALVKSNARVKSWTLSLLQLVAGLKQPKNQS